jgi:hypothetical protein
LCTSGVKRQCREADHLPPYIASRYAPHALMARCSNKGLLALHWLLEVRHVTVNCCRCGLISLYLRSEMKAYSWFSGRGFQSIAVF